LPVAGAGNIAVAQWYNARSTYRNLVSGDPNIRIASSTAPGAVRVRENVVYARPGGLSRAIGLYSPGMRDRPASCRSPFVISSLLSKTILYPGVTKCIYCISRELLAYCAHRYGNA
jgi:hypothetical protein